MRERIASLYEENARAFDRQRGRDLIERAWLDRFTAQLPEGAAILDVGCGMGEPIARYLIQGDLRLTGVDSSASMIAMCRERFPEQQWIVSDMRALTLGRCFEGIIAWHSLFHLGHDDQRGMFPRFAAHTGPGAMLMFTSGPQHGEAIGAWQGEPLYHASLDPDEYRALLGANGFILVDYCAEDADCGDATVWLARKH